MTYDIYEVSARLAQDPVNAIAAWEGSYQDQVTATAAYISANREKSPVVLLAGPSGSSKTTTAARIRDQLLSQGIRAHLISMDNYFLSRSDPAFPKLPDGNPDLESPDCLDYALLEEHFSLLETGNDIYVPIYDFPSHQRLPGRSMRMDASMGDVFIFEGIHALNERFTAHHLDACRVYVSPEDDFAKDGMTFCTPVLLRLMRRMVRDYQFRGATALYSLGLWPNVVESEKRYIAPYRPTANCCITTTLPYELGVLKSYVAPLVQDLPQDSPCQEEVSAIQRILSEVASLPDALVPQDSILREFIGGGV